HRLIKAAPSRTKAAGPVAPRPPRRAKCAHQQHDKRHTARAADQMHAAWRAHEKWPRDRWRSIDLSARYPALLLSAYVRNKAHCAINALPKSPGVFLMEVLSVRGRMPGVKDCLAAEDDISLPKRKLEGGSNGRRCKANARACRSSLQSRSRQHTLSTKTAMAGHQLRPDLVCGYFRNFRSLF